MSAADFWSRRAALLLTNAHAANVRGAATEVAHLCTGRRAMATSTPCAGSLKHTGKVMVLLGAQSSTLRRKMGPPRFAGPRGKGTPRCASTWSAPGLIRKWSTHTAATPQCGRAKAAQTVMRIAALSSLQRKPQPHPHSSCAAISCISDWTSLFLTRMGKDVYIKRRSAATGMSASGCLALKLLLLRTERKSSARTARKAPAPPAWLDLRSTATSLHGFPRKRQLLHRKDNYNYNSYVETC